MFTGSRILPPHPRRNHNSAPHLSAGERLTHAGCSPAAFITPPACPRPTAGRGNEANICGEDTFCKKRPPRTPPLKTVGSFCRSRHWHRSFSLEKRRLHCLFPQNNTQIGATTGRPYNKNRKNGQTYCAPDATANFLIGRRNRLFALCIFASAKTLLLHLTGGQSSALICASHCLTCVPETREKGWRNRVHTAVGVLWYGRRCERG